MKNAKHSLAAACVCVFAFTAVSGRMVLAESGRHVDAHTQADIKNTFKSLNIDTTTAVTYQTQPDMNPPYNLGRPSDASLQGGVNMLNFIRYVAGVPYNVSIDDTYQSYAQGACLINAINKELSHAPMQPAQMSADLYSICQKGAAGTNLARGYSNIAEAIRTGWLSDSTENNIKYAGHRRWILNPSMTKTGFGAVDGIFSMYLFGDAYKTSDYTGVSWPAANMPVGYFQNDAPWSVSVGRKLNGDDIKVSLKRKSDDKTWNFSAASSDGVFYVDNGGYGQEGCIIFRPNDAMDYKVGDVYDVNISGDDLAMAYSVNFFSLSDPDNTDTASSADTADTAKKPDTTGSADTTDTSKKDTASSSDTTNKDTAKKDTAASSDTAKGDTTAATSAISTDLSEIFDSIKASADDPRTPAQPVLSMVSAKSPTSMEIKWESVKGCTGYTIFRKAGSGKWKELVKTVGKKFTDTTVLPGVRYTYTVNAYYQKGREFLQGKCDTRGYVAQTSLKKPVISKVTAAEDHKNTVKITKSAGATGYEIYCKMPGGDFKKIANTKTLTYVHEKLQPGKEYRYKIRAYTTVDGVTVYSSFSKVTKLKAK